jgi:hypothetical protein
VGGYDFEDTVAGTEGKRRGRGCMGEKIAKTLLAS